MATGGEQRDVWQIGAGDAGRSYANLFLKFGVALIGPGDPGPWDWNHPDEMFEGSYVRRFATEVQCGDVLLLRSGNAAIRAVGMIASSYQYLPQFDDVNGWDLQHCRRVRWAELPEPYGFGRPVFGSISTRMSRVYAADVVDFASRFVSSPPTDWQSKTLPALPEVEPELAIASLPADLSRVVTEMRELKRVYWDSKAMQEGPSEDEIIAHIVVPLLRALDWPPEQIAVEWRDIDVCVFSSLPRFSESCRFLIEAKRPGTAVEGARDQAIGYVAALGKRCDVLVTDGFRYRLYDESKDFSPVAYANVLRLKASALDLFARLRNI